VIAELFLLDIKRIVMLCFYAPKYGHVEESEGFDSDEWDDDILEQ
jgi:hypothetical protein